MIILGTINHINNGFCKELIWNGYEAKAQKSWTISFHMVKQRGRSVALQTETDLRWMKFWRSDRVVEPVWVNLEG